MRCATYRSTAAQMVQLVLADEDRELVQVQHVVGVRCDLVWKERQKKNSASRDDSFVLGN